MDEYFMKEALNEAKKASEKGEVPIGAVIVRHGEIISRGHNLRETLKNALNHAEIIAIDSACKSLGGWRLTHCKMYVTLEPCPMCAGAILQSRIEELYIGAKDVKSGACGSVVNLLEDNMFNHNIKVDFGLCEHESSKILKDFFKELRARKKIRRDDRAAEGARLESV